MNKKTLATGFFTAVVASTVLLTSSVSAFWPFDSLFQKSGEVKAAVTDKVFAQPAVINDVDGLISGLATMAMTCKRISATQINPRLETRIKTVDMEKGFVLMKGSENQGLEKGKAAGNVLKTTASETGNTLGTVVNSTKSKELNSIASVLKTRCNEINKLYARMIKVSGGAPLENLPEIPLINDMQLGTPTATEILQQTKVSPATPKSTVIKNAAQNDNRQDRLNRDK